LLWPLDARDIFQTKSIELMCWHTNSRLSDDECYYLFAPIRMSACCAGV
jgi:hypothetical protein